MAITSPRVWLGCSRDDRSPARSARRAARWAAAGEQARDVLVGLVRRELLAWARQRERRAGVNCGGVSRGTSALGDTTTRSTPPTCSRKRDRGRAAPRRPCADRRGGRGRRRGPPSPGSARRAPPPSPGPLEARHVDGDVRAGQHLLAAPRRAQGQDPGVGDRIGLGPLSPRLERLGSGRQRERHVAGARRPRLRGSSDRRLRSRRESRNGPCRRAWSTDPR